MRSLPHRLLAALLLLPIFLAPAAGLADEEAARGDIRVLVRMVGKLDIRTHAGTPGEIKELLVQEAAATQADLLRFLEELATRNPTVKFRSHWILNAIRLTAPAEVVRKINDRPDVLEIVPDAIVDPPKTWPGARLPDRGDALWSIDIVNAPEVWRAHGLTGKGVLIGHIDTGADGNHPDLAGKIYAWKDCISGRPTPYDDQGHGTHSLGTIIGGSASGKAIGVAPDARVAVAKVFPASGGANTSDILAAMEWIMDPDGDPATDDAPRMVSNSWGSSSLVKTFWDPVAAWVQAGIFPCFAAGNSGPGERTVGTPGGFPHSFAVGATDAGDRIASFSSRGPVAWDGVTMVKPDVSAPGKDIRSAMPGGKYAEMSGTSMACPNVAGAITLLLQAAPDLTIAQIRTLLEETAVDLGVPGKDNIFGSGRIDVKRAVDTLILGGRLEGAVAGANGPLAGALVKAPGALETRTDAGGAFRATLKEGVYDLQVSAFGYLPHTQQVRIVRKQTTSVKAALKKAAQVPFSGTVTAKASGLPLAATVSFEDAPLPAVQTDPKTGRFAASVPSGAYRVKVSSFRHKTVVRDLTIGESGAQLAVALDKLPPVLLVADTKERHEKYYADALAACGVGHTLQVGAEGLSADALLQYPVVVWFTAGDSRTLDSNEQAWLTAFLKGGGSLLLSGQDIGYELKSAPFYRDVLKASYKADAAKARTVRGAAAPLADLAFALGGSGAAEQRYPDLVAALPGAFAPLEYAPVGGTAEGAAAVAWRDGVSAVLYLAFGFEGIADPAARSELMARSLRFLKPDAADLAAKGALLEARFEAGDADAAFHAARQIERLLFEVEEGLESGDHALLDAFLARAEADPAPQVHQAGAKALSDLLMGRDAEKFAAAIDRLRAILK